MHLVGVRVEMPTNNPIVLLREANGQHRVLPIFIGPVEATAIAFALQGVTTPRPMTHDLLRDLLNALDVGVDRVVITELRDSTFYAELRLTLAGQSHTVSSRPSDAIALAVRLGTSIYADDALIDAEGVVLAPEGDEDAAETPEAEELVEQFSEFIKTIRPEDFSG